MSISVPFAARCAGAVVLLGTAVALPAVAASTAQPKLKLPLDKAGAKRAGEEFGHAAKTKVLFRARSADGPVFLVVVKAKDRKLLADINRESVRQAVYVRRMEPVSGDAFEHTVKPLHAYDGFWTSRPGAYAWTAVRVDCKPSKGTEDCAIEAPARDLKIKPTES